MTSFKRSVHIYGIEGPVEMEGNDIGLSFHIKGSRKRVEITWPDIVKHCVTPLDSPSYLMSKPVELLQYLAAKVIAKRAKKEKNEDLS